MNFNIDTREIERQFFDTMRQAGIKPREDFSPIMDGKIYRFAVEGDKGSETSGAYYIHADDYPNWGFMDYHLHNRMQCYKFDYEAAGFTRDDRRAIAKELNNPAHQAAIKAKREKEQELQKENQARALVQAIKEYEHATFAGVSMHPYLYERFIKRSLHVTLLFQAWDFEYTLDVKPPSNALKIVQNPINGAYSKRGDLLIPITNILTGKIQDFQIISSSLNQQGKYQKGFYPRLSPKFGCVEIIPENSLQQNIIYLCEG